MAVSRSRIIAYIESESYRPLRIRELAKGLKIPESEYRTFRQQIKDLIADSSIVRLKGGRIGQPSKLNLKSGILQVNRKGVGFMAPEDGSEDIFIPADEMSTGLDKDRVLVRVKPGRRGRLREGAILKVLKRERNTIVGTFHRTRHFMSVEPDDERIGRDIYVHDCGDLRVENGQKVVIALSEWKNPNMNPQGKIIEILGYPDDPGVDILSTIRKFSLPTEFPEAVEKESTGLKLDISPAALEGRLDLRDKITLTIDPADAKDYDDAVSLEILDNGNYMLGVHIADVAHYVLEGTSLDTEARERATSVYLVDRVLPMLPERLSNDICSLRENEDRLTYSCLMEVTKSGDVKKTRIVQSVICSRARLSYDDVQEYFDDGNQTDKLSGLTQSLDLMQKLAKILRKRRLEMGSLDFDLPEPRVVLDTSGDVVDIRPRPRKESHKLVEEFMLLANRAVAEQFMRLGLPILYRVHEAPDPDRLDAYREFARGFGWELKITNPPKPIQLARFLKKIEGSDAESILNEMLLRSLKKACYQPDNIGHFGLAFSHYLHFTSPIRRYPDLLVHRLLKEIRNRRYPGKLMPSIKRLLKQVGEHSSMREKLAEEAERETVRIKQAIYLSKHVGDVFEGVVSGIMSFGFFVRLKKFSAEGMVRLSTLGDDYYQVDDNRLSITGSHTGKAFSLGDRVFVQIINVDLDHYQINLSIVSDDSPKKPRRRKNSIGKRKK